MAKTLRKSHAYYAQVQGQMGCTGCQSSFFIVWDPLSPAPHVEEIHFDAVFWEDMKRSLLIFFKQYVAKCLLRIKMIKYCGTCGSHCLEESEVKTTSDACFLCSICEVKFHKRCCKDVDNVCEGCLVNDLEENFDEIVI